MPSRAVQSASCLVIGVSCSRIRRFRTTTSGMPDGHSRVIGYEAASTLTRYYDRTCVTSTTRSKTGGPPVNRGSTATGCLSPRERGQLVTSPRRRERTARNEVRSEGGRRPSKTAPFHGAGRRLNGSSKILFAARARSGCERANRARTSCGLCQYGAANARGRFRRSGRGHRSSRGL